jgi:hypothetical protein
MRHQTAAIDGEDRHLAVEIVLVAGERLFTETLAVGVHIESKV